MITTRTGTWEDVTRLVILGRIAHEKSNYSDIPFNAQVTRATFHGAVRFKGQDVLIALRSDGSLCGFMIVLTIETPFSRLKYVTDGAFYAEQGGDKLIDEAIKWARARRIIRMDMSVSQGIDNDRIAHLYSRKGFVQTGTVHLLKLERAP